MSREDQNPNVKRVKAFHKGMAAEVHVKEHCITLGFELLHERYKTKNGEIDLIMQRGTQVVFIEVKARASVEEGLYSVTPKAQKRIANAASEWIAAQDQTVMVTYDFRFDVAVVTPDNQITLLENAFQTDG